MGCYKLGKAYEDGKAVPADKPKAIELYEQACKNEEGHVNACVRLWVAEGHAMPWRSRKGMTVTCMEDLGDCPSSKK
jgi:TPR repeat protein